MREVDENIKVMLHIENTDDVNGAVWWVEERAITRASSSTCSACLVTRSSRAAVGLGEHLRNARRRVPELSFAIAEYNPERTQANQIMKNLPDGRGLRHLLLGADPERRMGRVDVQLHERRLRR